MSLYTLIKITRTRYLLGKKQVPPGTPSAVKTTEESRRWYAFRREGKKQIKVRLSTDKAASLTEMGKMNTALERGEAGMINPHKEHLERDISAARERPLQDALYKPRGKGNSGKQNLTPCQLTDASRERFTRLGRERALLYKTAIYTGLRKGELAELRVKFLNLGRKPYPCL
jgi:hypothetical protein